MTGLLSALFTAWCLYVVWKWLFPGKEVREQRRHYKRERKLGIIYPWATPRDDSQELNEGIDFKMGKIFKWETAGDGMLLRFKPAIKDVSASIMYLGVDGRTYAGNRLPVRLYVRELGVLVIKAPMDGIFEACQKGGELKPGDSVYFLHTSPDYIEGWSAEFERAKEEEKRRRREQYLAELEEEKVRRESPEYKAKLKAEHEARLAQEKAEIASKLKEKQRRRDLEKQVRQELIDGGELFGDQTKRPPIPREVVDAVYRRDGGRCQECGATEDLQLDHIIPFSKGGATSVENLQLLCGKCNREKSNKIG